MGLTFELSATILRFFTSGDVEFVPGTQTLHDGLEAAVVAGAGSARRHLLFDIRESRENRSSDELRAIALLIAPYRSRLSGRCAVVVSDLLHYGLGRVFGAYLEGSGFTVEVFHTLAEAERWFESGDG